MNGEEELQFMFELNHESVERMSEDVKLNFRHKKPGDEQVKLQIGKSISWTHLATKDPGGSTLPSAGKNGKTQGESLYFIDFKVFRCSFPCLKEPPYYMESRKILPLACKKPKYELN